MTEHAWRAMVKGGEAGKPAGSLSDGVDTKRSQAYLAIRVSLCYLTASSTVNFCRHSAARSGLPQAAKSWTIRSPASYKYALRGRTDLRCTCDLPDGLPPFAEPSAQFRHGSPALRRASPYFSGPVRQNESAGALHFRWV